MCDSVSRGTYYFIIIIVYVINKCGLQSFSTEWILINQMTNKTDFSVSSHIFSRSTFYVYNTGVVSYLSLYHIAEI